MAINVEQTKKYYKDIKQEDLCDCNYCKNYYLQVKDAYPKVAEFLDSIGIDIEKPFETSPLAWDAGVLYMPVYSNWFRSK